MKPVEDYVIAEVQEDTPKSAILLTTTKTSIVVTDPGTVPNVKTGDTLILKQTATYTEIENKRIYHKDDIVGVIRG